MSELSGRAARIADHLAGWPRKRVQLAELWKLFDEVDPATRGSARRRHLLAGCLAELGDAGAVQLPAAGSFDRTQRPALPRFVTIPTTETFPAAGRSPVWHPELSWAATIRMTDAQARLLEQVNAWLFRGAGRGQPAVPLRERSLEILGDEKALDALAGTTIFGPGRLTLELLRSYRVTVPLHVTLVGPGDLLLVVENSDTFDSLRRVLSTSPGRVGRLAWGAGAGFESSVLSVAALQPAVREIRYFGDLDAVGLRIPAAASQLAVEHGLPAVRPATGLYTALLAMGRPQGGQLSLDGERAGGLAGWLDAPHREPCQRLLTGGYRIAQEAVGVAYLTAASGWQPG